MVDEKCFLEIEDCKEGIVKYPEYVETATYSEKKEEIMRRIEEKKGFVPMKSMKITREMSFKIKKSIELEKLTNLAYEIQGRFGIECFQISIDRETNTAHMLFNWILENGEPFVLNQSLFKRLVVMVLDFLKLPRPMEAKNWERWFLAESYNKDNNVFNEQINLLSNSNINGLNYTVVLDALSYAQKVCEGVVK
ncbi:hypothetical protein [Prevotella intermedia]|uniref:hypothetical protein n=1 Tax=Prevotella intermedia TaxID=28131 RepID=UPI000C23A076|nr:hypothetical protein [Prevotella intermedia]PJI21429.1 hypothetical protein CTM45_11490 [Prevotella intermedia]